MYGYKEIPTQYKNLQRYLVAKQNNCRYLPVIGVHNQTEFYRVINHDCVYGNPGCNIIHRTQHALPSSPTLQPQTSSPKYQALQSYLPDHPLYHQYVFTNESSSSSLTLNQRSVVGPEAGAFYSVEFQGAERCSGQSVGAYNFLHVLPDHPPVS